MSAGSEASKVMFANVPAEDCDLEVTADGFRQAKQKVTVNQLLLAKNQQVFIYLYREWEPVSTNFRPEVSPELLQEMDKAAASIDKKKLDDARKHLVKALRMAPTNPDVLFLSGTLYLDQNKLSDAEQEFQKAALRIPHTKGRGHFFAATAYSQLGEYPKAQGHAEQAIKLSNTNAAASMALYAQILTARGDHATARKEYELALSRFPDDPVAPLVRESLANIDKSEAAKNAAVSKKIISAGSVTSHLVWMPLEVDKVHPAVSSDVGCSDTDVVKRAALATTKQFENFERFTATEHIEHEEVNSGGTASKLRTRDFNYLVFVEQYPTTKQLYLNENRDGGVGVDAFPTFLATVGLVGLGVDVFQQMFVPALEFSCEGLGQWRGQPTWIVYFKQKTGVKSFLRLWRTATDTYEEPIKGRVWVSTNNYELLHMETDLTEPIKKLGLTRDHIAIDYGPVQFKKRQEQMWLPWSAEIFMDLNGRHYEHRHTLSNYAMFGVDTNNKIGSPKNAAPPEETGDKSATVAAPKPQ